MVSSVLSAACLVLWSGGAGVGWDLFVAAGKDGFFGHGCTRMDTDTDFKAAASLGSLGNFHVVRMFAFHFEWAYMLTRTMSSTRRSAMTPH